MRGRVRCTRLGRRFRGAGARVYSLCLRVVDSRPRRDLAHRGGTKRARIFFSPLRPRHVLDPVRSRRRRFQTGSPTRSPSSTRVASAEGGVNVSAHFTLGSECRWQPLAAESAEATRGASLQKSAAAAQDGVLSVRTPMCARKVPRVFLTMPVGPRDGAKPCKAGSLRRGQPPHPALPSQCRGAGGEDGGGGEGAGGGGGGGGGGR